MLLPAYEVVLVQSLATLEVEIWITGIDPPILPEGLDFPSSMAVLVHRQVESVTSRLTQCEGIVHGDLWVFLKPKVQSLIETLSCSLGREHD